MKKVIQLLILIVFLNSCTSTKNYSGKKNADNALQDALQQLNKNAENESAKKALPGLYEEFQHLHLSNIKHFKDENKDASPHWNDIILEYQSLQNAYNTIISSTPAFKIVQPKDYSGNIREIKEAAAEHFYQRALSILESPGRSNAKKAYTYFKICDYYVPNYKEVKSKINIAYGRAVINIVIDTLRDNSYFATSKWGQQGYEFSNEFLQNKLETDLQSESLNSEYPIAFYTKEEAKKSNVRVDRLIDLNLIEMNVSSPKRSTTNVLIANQTFATKTAYSTDNSFGTVTSPPIYNYQNTQLVITNNSSPVKVVMAINIKDESNEKVISYKMLTQRFDMGNILTDYGSQSPIANIENSYNQDLIVILEKLYSKIYPQIKSNISVALN